MAHLTRNHACEAKIRCPKCEKSDKGRKLKIHIKGTHKLLCLYICTFPVSGTKVCKFTCGKSLGCFIRHQEKRHSISFADGAEHKFTAETHVAFGLKTIVIDIHTPACDIERKSFKTTSQGKVPPPFRGGIFFPKSKRVIEVFQSPFFSPRYFF